MKRLVVALLLSSLVLASAQSERPELEVKIETDPLRNNVDIYVDSETILMDKEESLEEKIYIVKKGDTLIKIARRFGTTVYRLQEDNDLEDAGSLEVGDSLIIRRNKAEKEDTRLEDELEEQIYVVKKGDTLFKIAKMFGVTVRELQEMNGLKDVKKLKIGDSLIIRGDKAVPEETILGNKRGNLEERIYIVKRGDTLYSLAKKFKTTVDKIQDDNRLHDARKLEIGDNLIIREHGIERKRESLKLEKEERKYIVERGDTLLKIVKKLGMTVYELQQRGIVENTDDIKVGDILIIK